MNIFSNLPGLKLSEGTELTDEERAAEEKRDRIKFHRESVRNGPVKFSHTTTGQLRRARQRAMTAMQRKGYRRQVRAHFANLREASILRAKLQGVGLLDSYVEIPEASGHKAALWIIAKFGDRQAITEQGLTVDIVEVAFLNALNRWEELSGLQKSDELPDDYSVTA